MGNSEQNDFDQAMLDQMFKEAGQHLLIKELVLQTLVSQLKGVGIDIDPTPGKMMMVNTRAEKAEADLVIAQAKIAQLQLAADAGATFPTLPVESTVVTVKSSVKPSTDWTSNNDHTAFVDSFKVQDHPSVEAVKDFDFSSPEAAHLSQEQEDLGLNQKSKRKAATQHFPIQPIEAIPVKQMSYDGDEYDD